jgi:hypothetical protein
MPAMTYSKPLARARTEMSSCPTVHSYKQTVQNNKSRKGGAIKTVSSLQNCYKTNLYNRYATNNILHITNDSFKPI